MSYWNVEYLECYRAIEVTLSLSQSYWMWLQGSSRLKSHNFFIFENQFGALLDYVLFWNYEKMCRNFPFLLTWG